MCGSGALDAVLDTRAALAAGSVGMLAFAIWCSNVPGGIVALVTAAPIRAFVSVIGYVLIRIAGYGTDER